MSILVTGASSPIGQEIAKALAKEGYDLVLQYFKNKKLCEELAQTCRSFSVQAKALFADFSSAKGIDQFLKHYLTHYPNTLGLINNASKYLLKSTLETSLEDFTAILKMNLEMPFTLCRALASSLKKKQGFIVHVGVAGLGACRADTYSSVYTLSKQGLYFLTKSLAKELAKDQVRVNMLSPGHLAHSIDLPALEKLPMQRFVTNEEFIKALLFLIDPKNASLSGHNLELSGAVRL